MIVDVAFHAATRALGVQVNRTGNGCNNEGCRPLATFGRRGGPSQ